MLKTVNCIRMGEVLFDENLHLFILCNNCHTDIKNLQEFHQHLEKCDGLENLFQPGLKQFKYNNDKCTQLFGKTNKGIKEFLIYDYNDVEVTYAKKEENFIDLINIEEELLDPKWYSDLAVEVNNTSPQKTSKQYEELVEAVTPFVQFKENLKSNNNARNSTKVNLVKSSTEQTKTIKGVKFDLAVNKTTQPTKRKLSYTKPLPSNVSTPTVTPGVKASPNSILLNSTISRVQEGNNKKCKIESKTSNGFVKPAINNPKTSIGSPAATTNMLPPTTLPVSIVLNPVTRKPASIPPTFLTHEPTKEKQTAQILNKLQNLGLQVKRTQQLPQPVAANNAASNKTDTKTLEILQRLQSKGMKVKILNKQQPSTAGTNVNIPMAKQQQQGSIMCIQKPTHTVRNPVTNVSIKQNLNKNLIIKKVN